MALQLVRDTLELTAYDHYDVQKLCYDPNMPHDLLIYDDTRDVFIVNRESLLGELAQDERHELGFPLAHAAGAPPICTGRAEARETGGPR
jgi:hypothetical protein